MMLRVASFAVCLVLAVCYGGKNVHFMEISQKAYQPGQLVYTACNTSYEAAVFLKSLEVLPPTPIEFGKIKVVSADVVLAKDISGDIDYDMDIVMCIPNVGCQSVCDLVPEYCTGKDVCSLLSKMTFPCPAVVTKQGSNCKCPFKKNTYQFQKIPIPIPEPPYKISGNFSVTMKLKQAGTELSCWNIKFCLENC